jgi:LuxR family maltose regulon positive regulatory protein
MVILARLKLAQGDTAAAASLLEEAERFLWRLNILGRMPDVAAVRVRLMQQRGDLTGAAALAAEHHLAPSRARVYLAQDDPGAAFDSLTAWREEMEARGEESKRLQALTLQALALYALDEAEQALALLEQALALAEPGGLVRLFLDEGPAMAQLLATGVGQGIRRGGGAVSPH